MPEPATKKVRNHGTTQLLKDTEIVTQDELLMPQVIQLDAATQQMIEKEIIIRGEAGIRGSPR
jgi:hypothetical protein